MDVSINYAEVDACATRMRDASRDVLRPANDRAKGAIDTVLSNGGLRMPETGQAVEEGFGKVYDIIQQLCDAVDSYAQQFVDIKENMITFDKDFAEKIRNPQ
jgi:hypothetical protein